MFFGNIAVITGHDSFRFLCDDPDVAVRWIGGDARTLEERNSIDAGRWMSTILKHGTNDASENKRDFKEITKPISRRIDFANMAAPTCRNVGGEERKDDWKRLHSTMIRMIQGACAYTSEQSEVSPTWDLCGVLVRSVPSVRSLQTRHLTPCQDPSSVGTRSAEARPHAASHAQAAAARLAVHASGSA